MRSIIVFFLLYLLYSHEIKEDAKYSKKYLFEIKKKYIRITGLIYSIFLLLFFAGIVFFIILFRDNVANSLLVSALCLLSACIIPWFIVISTCAIIKKWTREEVIISLAFSGNIAPDLFRKIYDFTLIFSLSLLLSALITTLVQINELFIPLYITQ